MKQQLPAKYTPTDILEFLRERPFLSNSKNMIEKACNIPQSTLSKALKGHMGLPAKHVPALVRELAKYGLK